MDSSDRPPIHDGAMDPVLRRVYERGHKLRLRRKLLRAASSAMVVLVIAATGVLAFTRIGGVERDPGSVFIGPPTAEETTTVSPSPSTSPTESASPQDSQALNCGDLVGTGWCVPDKWYYYYPNGDERESPPTANDPAECLYVDLDGTLPPKPDWCE